MAEQELIVPRETGITQRGATVERVKRLLKLKNDIMVEGTHYVSIGDKPCLTKIGAEAMRVEFGLGVRTKHDREIMEDGERMYTVTSEVYEIATGIMWSTGIGCSCTDEKEFVSRGIAANTTIKIAEKRANIDATINACGGSEIFTQDLDDYSQEDLEKATIVKSSGAGKTLSPPKKISTGIPIPSKPAPAAAPEPVPVPVKDEAPSTYRTSMVSYAEWWSSQNETDRENLRGWEMHYRSKMDQATTMTELDAVGADIGKQKLPEVFVEFMRDCYHERKRQIVHDGQGG